MADTTYRHIVEHYESCLALHGDTHRGVDWPRPEDAKVRYSVMLDVINTGHDASSSPVSLLDFGCGAGHLLDYIQRGGLDHIQYTGLDASDKFVALCRTKHPDVEFHCTDVLEDRQTAIPQFDYVVANGVFTEKREMPYEAMLSYFEAMLEKIFAMAKVGIAFNVMSKHVDWERSDLFHVPLDTLAGILTSRLSRHYVIRNDYGLYEYTTYVYREPTRWPRS